MEIINSKQLEELIESKDFFSKVMSLNEVLSLSNTAISRAFELLQEADSDNRMVVSEIIFNVISNARKLEDDLICLYNETNDEDLRFDIAIILMETGNLSVKNDLINFIREGEIDKAIEAAIRLSKFKIKEAIEPIQNRLLSCTNDQLEQISHLIDALDGLGGKVPKELNTRLSELELPWHLKIRFENPGLFKSSKGGLK